MRKSNICRIHGLRIVVGITIILLLLVGSVEAATEVNSCTYIYSPGEYILTQDIITDISYCINIYTNDVIFDGNSHTIDGIGSGYTCVAVPGVNASGQVQNVTVKNLTVTGWYYGICLSSYSSNNTLNNNVILNNHYGIYLSESNWNIIYNNYFDNFFNAYDDGKNFWNTTKQAGTNIIGGPHIGGNYWSDYAGSDTDGDGLGNTLTPHNSSGNIHFEGDYLPLKENVTQEVSAGETVTTDIEGTGTTVLDPVETSVTTPNAGTVSIEETFVVETSSSDFQFIGWQVTITAPNATVENPLIIVFTINSSKVPVGEDENSIQIFKDGELVEDNIGTTIASPDPCVSNRKRLPNEDIEITVLTSNASIWDLIISSGVIPAYIDIDQDTLNLESNGEWLIAHIELPESCAVNDIDVSTIYLEEVIPVDTNDPITIGDHDSDGIPDMMVKFNRTVVVLHLRTEDVTEDETGTDYEELTITGELTYGAPFEGCDTIRVIEKGKSE